VNVAVFAGFRAYGVLGGLAATIAMITPSLIIVSLAAKALQRYRENATVGDVFALLRPMSVGLIAGAVFPLIVMAVTVSGALNPLASGIFAIMTVSVVLGERKKVHPLVFIAIGAILGIVFGGL
jgi:chromate transporter